MSNTKKREELIKGFKEMIGKGQSMIFVATVASVDESVSSCVVKTLNEVEIYNVRLKASIGDNKDGIVQVPLEGSTVLVGMIGNEVSELFIVAFSEVEKVVFYGGSNGGLINIQTLKEQLDKTNEVVNALKESVTGFTPVTNDGGNALKIYANAQLSGKDTGDFSNMEDNKVLH